MVITSCTNPRAALTVCLIAFLPTLPMAQDSTSQINALDIGTLDAPMNPGLSSETRVLEPDQTEVEATVDAQTLRNGIQREILDAQKAGFMTPENADLSAYPLGNLSELKAILENQSDPCLRAVETALFLNAKYPPDILTYAGKLTVEGLPSELADIWIKPDEFNAMDMASSGWTNALVNGFDLAKKSLQTYDAFVDAHVRAVIDRQATWTQQMVHQAIRNDYDDAALTHARDRLAHILTKNANWLERIEERTEKELTEADKAYEAAISDARGFQRYELREHAKTFGDNWEINSNTAAIIAYNRIISNYTAAERVAVYARDAARDAIYALRQKEMTMAMEAMSEAKVKFKALEKYVEPISKGECETLGKDAKRAPTIDAEALVIDRIKRLDQPRFDKLMAKAGVEVPTDFYACLCANSGTPGVGGGMKYSEGKCWAIGVLGGASEVKIAGHGNAANWKLCLDKVTVTTPLHGAGTRMQDVLLDKLRDMPGRRIE